MTMQGPNIRGRMTLCGSGFGSFVPGGKGICLLNLQVIRSSGDRKSIREQD